MLRHLALLTAVVVLQAGAPPLAAAGVPTDQLRSRIDQVLDTLAKPELNARPEARRASLRSIVDDIFDWDESARRSLGRHWAARTPAERQEFVRLFADLVQRSWISKIDLYDRQQVLYVSDSVEGDEGVVRSKVVTKAGSEIALDYRMRRHAEDRWKVYDLQIAGASLVSNYRAQFDKIIASESYPALVQRMRSKATETATSAPAR
jgi:phospholipid transport system substrate-binding protein